jgi:hypothetical protein
MPAEKDVKNTTKSTTKTPGTGQVPNQSTKDSNEPYDPLPANSYEWRCVNCDAHEPNNTVGWMKIRSHAKGHEVALCEKESGDIVARSYKEAIGKGIDVPKTGGQQSGSSSSGAEGKDGEGGDDSVMTATGIKETVILPALAHAYYDAAIQHGYVDVKMTYDEFLFDCVQERFRLDFGVVIGLVKAENIGDGEKETSR